jgi:hypothetical protein
MEFGPRETKVRTSRTDDGRIRVAIEHVRAKVTAEAVADHYDEAKRLAYESLSAKVKEAMLLAAAR